MTCKLYGQHQICGQITDASNQPLTGVNVALKGSSEGTVSDEYGRYKLETTQVFPVAVVFSYVGFHTLEITLEGPSADLDVVLEEGLILADDVVVSASRRREKITDAPASMSMITERRMAVSPNDNPLKTFFPFPFPRFTRIFQKKIPGLSNLSLC